MSTHNLNALAHHINATAHQKGWYDAPDGSHPVKRNFGEVVALMHSELSEGLEAHRSKLPAVYDAMDDDGLLKPEGWAVELVDCIIRILDTLREEGIDVDKVIDDKMIYNTRRKYRHGGKSY